MSIIINGAGKLLEAMAVKDLMAYIDSNVDGFVEDLRRICQQPSVSAQDEGTGECVKVLKEMMVEAGLEVRAVPVEGGNPVVLGELKAKGAEESIQARDSSE